MRVAITGATGLVGRPLIAALRERGDDPVAVSRDAAAAQRTLGVEAHSWEDLHAALHGTDAIVALHGESVAQRWTEQAKQAIRSSRLDGIERLLAAVRTLEQRPRTLVSASAVGYYGDRGAEVLDEHAAPGADFLADVCVAWERAAYGAEDLGLRVCTVRTGVVLDRGGGALAQMLPPFRLGLGGPAAGGRQYMSWIGLDDLVGIYLAALSGDWSGPVNAVAPNPATNAEFSKTLGHVLGRPAVVPVPALALRALFGEMAIVVIGGQRALPAAAAEHGYSFRHEQLEPALRAALNG